MTSCIFSYDEGYTVNIGCWPWVDLDPR